MIKLGKGDNFMSKRFLVILLALFTLFVGVVVISKRDTSDTASVDSSAGSNHVAGESTTGVTLVEFGDFQCPACASYYPIVNQIKSEYADQITFQFRHFPLINIHPNAMAAHRAAEAAGRQGKFFEMHDLLYARQRSWAEAQNASQIFEDFATELGLNIDQYKQDVASQSVLDVINADIKVGQNAGAQSTPTFVLNGERLDPAPQSYNEFKTLIDEAINAQSSDQ